MNQPFEIAEEKPSITGSVIVDAARFAGAGLGLPEDFAKESQEKADLIDRRLSRIEQALNLYPVI
jgi:hypothetical protein